VQKVFWVYLTNNFIVTSLDDFKNCEPVIKCEFLPITLENFSRVRDFRDQSRVLEYRAKLAHREMFFLASLTEKWLAVFGQQLMTPPKTPSQDLI
jgi:hypothetical protein